MMMITAYTIDKKDHGYGRSEKQTAKLHEERKYVRESARNYGDRIRCVLLFVLAFLPPQAYITPLSSTPNLYFTLV